MKMTRWNLMMALAALALTGAAAAQQAAQAVKSAADPAATNTAAAPATHETEEAATVQKPGGESLTVHGHWKIEIKNPDGSLDRTVEFNNALSNQGKGEQLLAQLLTGQIVMGDWAISFLDNYSGHGTQYWCTAGVGCVIDEVSGQGPIGYHAPGSPHYSGLQVTYFPSTGSGSKATNAYYVLRGSATATQSTAIYQVGTSMGYCAVNKSYSGTALQSPSACAKWVPADSQFSGASENSFTSHTISPMISVTLDQIVQFTVTISFS